MMLSKRIAALSLMEVALSLLILGLTATSIVNLWRAHRIRHAITQQEQNFELIEAALKLYITQRGHLPDPGPDNLIPLKTLHLPERYSHAYGKPIKLLIHPDFTKNNRNFCPIFTDIWEITEFKKPTYHFAYQPKIPCKPVLTDEIRGSVDITNHLNKTMYVVNDIVVCRLIATNHKNQTISKNLFRFDLASCKAMQKIKWYMPVMQADKVQAKQKEVSNKELFRFNLNNLPEKEKLVIVGQETEEEIINDGQVWDVLWLQNAGLSKLPTGLPRTQLYHHIDSYAPRDPVSAGQRIYSFYLIPPGKDDAVRSSVRRKWNDRAAVPKYVLAGPCVFEQ